ncbi:MAG: alkaline phosphatase family protein [Chloroflexi bacterium]|nr:alkaline phosphatase family protein [Chloroflexota bacterium]
MPRVLVAVFDGLQQSQVTPELMPNLHTLAREGISFNNHHAVFPSVTRINGSSMVTGRYPGAHGLAANMVVMRDFDPHQCFSALEPTLKEVAAKLGEVLLVPTLADILHRYGKEYVAVGTGTSGNAYMHNPNAHRSGGATIHPDFALPRSLYGQIIARFGPWPEDSVPNTERLARAVRVMTEYVIPERDPAVCLIWFSEPDHAHHRHGVGHATSNLAIHEADHQFGNLLGWLERTGRSADTDVIVISDHGYSTIGGVVNMDVALRQAGFPDGAQPGGVIAAPNGGAVLFYVNGKDAGVADRLAAWLMAQPWCGALAASEAVAGIPGTLPAGLLGIEGKRAPELAMSFRWESRANEHGYPGVSFATGGAPGLGQHGSMSKHEMHNILFARGPRFKKGAVSNVPTGNIDLTPTILHLLGLDPGVPLDGRPILEALDHGPTPAEVAWETEVHTAERSLKGGVYRQEVQLSHVGGTAYVDWGQGSLEKR